MTGPKGIREAIAEREARPCRCGAPRTRHVSAEILTRGGTAWRRFSGCERCADRWAFEELANGARSASSVELW